MTTKRSAVSRIPWSIGDIYAVQWHSDWGRKLPEMDPTYLNLLIFPISTWTQLENDAVALRESKFTDRWNFLLSLQTSNGKLSLLRRPIPRTGFISSQHILHVTCRRGRSKRIQYFEFGTDVKVCTCSLRPETWLRVTNSEANWRKIYTDRISFANIA